MRTKSKSEKFGEWLDTVIDITPIVEDYPQLEGTGIVFYKFNFKEGVSMLSFGITPQLVKQFPTKDQNKYNIDLSGEKAFAYRVYNGKSNSPCLQGKFTKLVEDSGRVVNHKTFGYINDWINSKVNKWEINK